MAKHFNTTTAAVVDTIIASGPGRIAALFAIRSGVVALVDHLAAESALTPDVEQAFGRSLDALFELDTEIMATDAADLAELRMQAIVAGHDTKDDGPFCHEHVARLLSSIERLAA